MKILCVNNKPLPNSYNTASGLAAIEEGVTYDGYLDSVYTPDDKEEKGWIIPSINVVGGYAYERFVPLSDLDETELVTEEFEEKYCVPVKR